MKLKTHKTVSKRYKVTKTKKIIHRASGQGHFNSRESGNVTRAKRTDRKVSGSDVKSIKQYIPYH